MTRKRRAKRDRRLETTTNLAPGICGNMKDTRQRPTQLTFACFGRRLVGQICQSTTTSDNEPQTCITNPDVGQKLGPGLRQSGGRRLTDSVSRHRTASERGTVSRRSRGLSHTLPTGRTLSRHRTLSGRVLSRCQRGLSRHCAAPGAALLSPRRIRIPEAHDNSKTTVFCGALVRNGWLHLSTKHATLS